MARLTTSHPEDCREPNCNACEWEQEVTEFHMTFWTP